MLELCDCDRTLGGDSVGRWISACGILARAAAFATRRGSRSGCGISAFKMPGTGHVVSVRTASRLRVCSGRPSAAAVGVIASWGDGLGIVASRNCFDETLGSVTRSRCKPNRKSLPSLRQFRVIAENCSRCHRMVSCDPMVNGRCTRTQAPDGEVSSRVAGARKDVPVSSFHVSSASAHIVLRGSIVRSSMSTVSA